ncbi:MAG: hypothetical protein IJ002_04160 [Clostridia bacterium]|nr:hypothetical protein [Clostridia bacterium]
MTKRIPLFYIFLLALVIIVIIVTAIGKSYLKDVLLEYEDSQYKYVAENFFDSNFSNGNSETLAELFASQISEYETTESFATYLSTIINNGDFTLQHSSSGLSDKEKYVVSIDNLRFAEVYISKSGDKTKHGFDTYTVSEVVFNSNLLNTYSIEVPVGYTVNINGHTADEKYALGDRIETESQSFMPEGVDGIIYTTYTFSDMCTEPNFTVFNKNNTETTVVCEDGVYRAEVVYDTKLADEYSEYVIEATKAYACYMQKDAAFGKVKGYIDPDSDFYAYVRGTPTWPVISHNGYAFEDAVVTEFYAYSDDVFSCRINLTHVLKYSGLEDYRDSIDITWYFRNVDGKYLIYDSFTH